MLTNYSVTVWHNGTPAVYKNVHTSIKEGLDKNGIKQKGFFEYNNCILRIPTEKELQISIGDYVRCGIHGGNPDRNTDLKIMQISKNLFGTSPHYRVVCER